MGKIDNNKQMKRESLLDSAFSLFIDNGFNKTSISDIVNNAGVAKGTFYLYFKDGSGIIALDYDDGVRGISDSLTCLEMELSIGLERSVLPVVMLLMRKTLKGTIMDFGCI